MAVDQYREDVFHAFEMLPDVGIPATAGTHKVTTLQGKHIDYWEFDDAADMAVHFTWMVPEDWDPAQGEMRWRTYSETAHTTEDDFVYWKLYARRIRDGEDLNKSMSTYSSYGRQFVNASASAGDLMIDNNFSAFDTFTDLRTATYEAQAGDLIKLCLIRDVSNEASAPITVPVRLLKFGIQYHTLGASNARWGEVAAPTDYTHYWSFDNVSGSTVFDEGSGTTSDGTLEGGAAIATGIVSNGCDMQTSDSASYMSFPQVTLHTSTGNAALSCWFKTPTMATEYLWYGDSNEQVLISNSTTIRLIHGSGGTQTDFVVPTMSINTWYHLVINFTDDSGVTPTLYLNAVSSLTAGVPSSTTFRLDQFGSDGVSTGFDGLADELMIFDRVLTANEIHALYEQGIGAPDLTGKVYREKYIPASKMLGDLTDPPLAGTRQETTLQGGHYDFLEFEDADSNYCYFKWVVPEDIDTTAGTFSYRFYWETDTTAAEDCMWEVGEIGVNDNENLDQAPANTVTLIASSDGGAARDLNIDTIRSYSYSFTKGDLVTIRVGRLGDHSSGLDDLTDISRLLGLGIQWLADEDTNNAQWS